MPGSWQPLVQQPQFNASTMLLLTDGTVMCFDEGLNSVGSPHVWNLVPDPFGNYVKGTWKPLPSLPVSPTVGQIAPLYFASAVLKDGRVFRAGGEYNGSSATADLLSAEIFDPFARTWTVISTPPGWVHLGDAISCVFPDGRVLVGSIDDNRTAIYDPIANTWSAGGNKLNQSSDEETWTLLPDGTILTAECFGHPQTEKFDIASNVWTSTGPTVTDLVEDSSKEIGPAILLPDGRVFAIGATGRTGLFSRAAIAGGHDTWADGPTFPEMNGQQLIAKDAPAALLPNGRVLCAVSPVGGCPASNQGYCPPTYFYEYDPTAPIATALTSLIAPPNAGNAVFNGRMLLLPTGQVLYASGGTDIEVYTPNGSPNPAWRPQITACSSSLQQGKTYLLAGKQLNGLSQAVSYGDDAQMATNYPLVRIRNLASNHIAYCPTRNHSSMGVATGNTTQSTQFTLPGGIETGASELTVVANGIPSDAIPVTVLP
jgi:hypothetical protein